MTHLVVGTAGHIDHGKSTLVHALTGTDPDRLREEKARGITIDLGFAHARIGDLSVAFVDVPGHERFVKNMLAGAGGIDAVLLVVAADEGVKPQTREHLDICRLLDVRRGLVALTKADLADADMLELVQLEVRDLLAGTPLHDAALVPVCSRTGQGLDALRHELAACARQLPGRDAAAAARLAIDRVFSLRGFGTVVTGTLAGGKVAVDDELEVRPRPGRVKVRGLQVHGGRRAVAVAGERVALNVAGAGVTALSRGQTLAAPGTLPVTSVVDVAIAVLPGARPIRHGARVRFHQGTAEVLARVATVGPPADGPPVLAPDSAGLARLRLESPAALTRGDRFVLRSYSPSTTVGGGRVLDPAPPRGGVRAEATRARLGRLLAAFDAGDEQDALLAFVEQAGAGGVTLDALAARAGAFTTSGRAALDRLAAGPDVWRVGDRLLAAAWRTTLEARVRAALSAHHDREPHSEGLAREQVREGVLGGAHPEVATAVVDRLVAEGAVRGRDRLSLSGRGVRLTPEETAGLAAVEALYRDGGLTPPDADALPAATGLPASMVASLTPLLVRQQVLVKVATFLFHRDALHRLRAEIAALKGVPGARVDVAAFKQRYGLTRKHAIPLLEYLDRERITRRVGESRVVL